MQRPTLRAVNEPVPEDSLKSSAGAFDGDRHLTAGNFARICTSIYICDAV